MPFLPLESVPGTATGVASGYTLPPSPVLTRIGEHRSLKIRTRCLEPLDKPSFEAKCARRVLQAEVAHDDMIQIECDTFSGKVDYSAARVVLSSKQWRAAKLAPKKYGDTKQDQQPNTPQELVIRVEGGFAKPKTGNDTESS